MKISVPTATTLVSSNVVDTTDTFDDTAWITYPLATKYQFGNSIYENTTATYTPPLYSTQGSFNVGDTVWDNITGKVKRILAISGEIPKQPVDYISSDVGFDYPNYLEAWTEVRDVPTMHLDNTYTNALSPYGLPSETRFNSTGTRLYEKASCCNTIYQSDLSVAWDITSAIIDTQSTLGVGTIKGFFFKPDGSVIYFVDYDTGDATYHLCSRPLGTAWDISSMGSISKNPTNLPGNNGLESDPTGTMIFLADSNSDKISKYTLSTAWDTLSAMTFIEDIDAGDTAPGATNFIRNIRFNTDGSILYLGEAYSDSIWEYVLNAPYDLSLINNTIIHNNFTDISTIDIDPTGMFLYIGQSSYDRIARFTLTTAWDISTSYYTVFPIIGFDTNGSKYTIIDEGAGIYSYKITVGSVTQTSSLYAYNLLDTDSIINSGIEILVNSEDVFLAKTMVIDPTGIYLRTWVNSLETITTVEYTLGEIVSPKDLENFSFIEYTNWAKPFDGKNYSSATTTYEMLYTIYGTESFDTIALGKCKANHIKIKFIPTGVLPEDIEFSVDEDINTSRDTNGNLADWNTTLIYYSTTLMEANSIVEIIITGTNIELATLLLGMSSDAGFTNLALKNDYKDFSVFEYDEWGNADYTERAKVSRYSGSVDIFIEDYDKVDRLMTSLGKNLVIVNGSDSNSTPDASTTIFAATQKIGRFLSFSQKTLIKDNDIGRVANYTFTLEEIV